MPRTKIDNLFTPYVTLQALEIMEMLSRRPCAKPFIDFFPGLEISNFNNIEIISISIIIQRLKTNDYFKITEWQHDMKQIHQNCIILFGSNNMWTILANQLYSIFEKRFELYGCFNKAKWTKLVGLLSHQINFRILQKPPELFQTGLAMNSTLIQNYPYIYIPYDDISPQFSTNGQITKSSENTLKQNRSNHIQNKPIKSIECPSRDTILTIPEKESKTNSIESPTFSMDKSNSFEEEEEIASVTERSVPFVEKDVPDVNEKSDSKLNGAEREERIIYNFLTAFSTLDSKSDAQMIAQIIHRNQPQLKLVGRNPKIDIRQLNRHTLKELMRYTKNRLICLQKD